MDAITRQHILDSLPDIQKRSRRAKRLREQEEQFAEMANRERELGSVGHAQQGGLFPTVASYVPNTGGMTEKALGAVGQLWAGHKVDSEEEALQRHTNPEIINAVNQVGQKDLGPDAATDNTLKAYLGMIGGPDVKDIFGKDKHLTRQGIEKGTGNIWNFYSDGSKENTGIVQDPKRALVTQPGLPISTVDMNGEDVGEASAVQFGEGGADPTAVPAAAPAAVPVAAPAAPAAPVDPNAPAAPAPTFKGLEGLPPETMKQVQATTAMMTSLGYPQEQIDDVVARAVAQQEAMANGQVPGPVTTVSEPGVVPPGAGVQPPPPAPPPMPLGQPAPMAVQGPRTFTVPTAGQVQGERIDAQLARSGSLAAAAGSKAGAEAAARTDAVNARAAASAQTAGMTSEATHAAANRVAAKHQLPKAQSAYKMIATHVGKILNNPKLSEVIGASVHGRAGALPGAATISDILLGTLQLKGPKGADLNAAINQLSDEAFLTAYTDALQGTGQVATIEGLKSAQAALRTARYQSPEQFKAALMEFLSKFKDATDRLEAEANTPAGPVGTTSAAESIDDIIKRNAGG